MFNNFIKYMEICIFKFSIWENVEVEVVLLINLVGDDRILGIIVWFFSSVVILIFLVLRKILK